MKKTIWTMAAMLLLSTTSITAQNFGRRNIVRKNVPVDSILLSDPFVLADETTKTY